MKNKIHDYLAIVMNFHFINPVRSQTNRKRAISKTVKRQREKTKYPISLVVSLLCFVFSIVYITKYNDISKRLEKCQNTLTNTQSRCAWLEAKVIKQDTVNAVYKSYDVGLEDKCKQLWQQNEFLYKSITNLRQNTSKAMFEDVIFDNCGAAVVTGGEVNIHYDEQTTK